jgi:hypothetical protein
VCAALVAAKTGDDWKDDPYWLAFFDDAAMSNFWWPTEAEVKDWERRWFHAPGHGGPTVAKPKWLFGSLIRVPHGDYASWAVGRLLRPLGGSSSTRRVAIRRHECMRVWPNLRPSRGRCPRLARGHAAAEEPTLQRTGRPSRSFLWWSGTRPRVACRFATARTAPQRDGIAKNRQRRMVRRGRAGARWVWSAAVRLTCPAHARPARRVERRGGGSVLYGVARRIGYALSLLGCSRAGRRSTNGGTGTNSALADPRGRRLRGLGHHGAGLGVVLLFADEAGVFRVTLRRGSGGCPMVPAVFTGPRRRVSVLVLVDEPAPPARRRRAAGASLWFVAALTGVAALRSCSPRGVPRTPPPAGSSHAPRTSGTRCGYARGCAARAATTSAHPGRCPECGAARVPAAT